MFAKVAALFGLLPVVLMLEDRDMCARNRSMFEIPGDAVLSCKKLFFDCVIIVVFDIYFADFLRSVKVDLDY